MTSNISAVGANEVTAIGSWLSWGHGTNRVTWPNPADPADVEWRLRYGDAVQARLAAASYVSAYRQMVFMPRRDREKVIATLRAAAERIGAAS